MTVLKSTTTTTYEQSHPSTPYPPPNEKLPSTKLRSEFNLPEDPCGDCLVHCFCEPCALCQEYREFKNRGFDPALGWAGNVARQQRQQGVPMTPPLGQAMHK
eukprot:Gb_02805 [translate_table: standard]